MRCTEVLVITMSTCAVYVWPNNLSGQLVMWRNDTRHFILKKIHSGFAWKSLSNVWAISHAVLFGKFWASDIHGERNIRLYIHTVKDRLLNCKKREGDLLGNIRRQSLANTTTREGALVPLPKVQHWQTFSGPFLVDWYPCAWHKHWWSTSLVCLGPNCTSLMLPHPQLIL